MRWRLDLGAAVLLAGLGDLLRCWRGETGLTGAGDLRLAGLGERAPARACRGEAGELGRRLLAGDAARLLGLALLSPVILDMLLPQRVQVPTTRLRLLLVMAWRGFWMDLVVWHLRQKPS